MIASCPLIRSHPGSAKGDRDLTLPAHWLHGVLDRHGIRDDGSMGMDPRIKTNRLL
jgi:hypothetical protein